MEILCNNLNFDNEIKLLDKNYKILINFLKNNSNNISKEDYKEGYKYIHLYFKNCNDDKIIYYIYVIRFFIKILDKTEIIKLLDDINNKSEQYIDNKFIVSSLKSLSIYCNKYINKNNINKKIESILDALKLTNNVKRIFFYLNKILIYLNNNSKNVNYEHIFKIIKNIDIFTLIEKDNNENKYIFFTFLKILNKCKLCGKITNSELENILLSINKHIYSYIFFLNIFEKVYDDKEKIFDFVINLGFESKKFEEIDNLNLKRGFITGLSKNDKNYLLKYQPNKSVMELIINSYLYSYNYNNFLLPKYFYINNDNSYFYIIEKYNTDLHKYFNILESNDKTLLFKDILHITKFLIDSISILHNHNIIHSDFKLENIVLNIDNEYNIKELKIIDFDVALFNIIPSCFNDLSEKYDKILKNKKSRGTRIYMNNNDEMSFNNDIFSMGVISIILLYKNIKLFLANSRNIVNKKKIKKLVDLRSAIDKMDKKIKMLNCIESIVNKNCVKKKTKNNFDFLDEIYDINKYKLYNQFILDCINNKYNIEQLKNEYKDLFY